MTHFDSALAEQLFHGWRQLKQAQQISHRGPRLADGIGHGLMCQRKFLDQALDTDGFFQRVEVFALDVLNQRHCECLLVRHGAHQHWHA